MAKSESGKKKKTKNIPSGICYIQASFNNTIVTITDLAGDVVSWSSSGCHGFKGSRKSTPFASQVTAVTVAEAVINDNSETVKQD